MSEKNNHLEAKKRAHNTGYEMAEDSVLHNPYHQEVREQQSIREGNLEALEESIDESYSGKIGVLAKNPLRNEKNHAIVVVALSSRSAIEGGADPQEIFSMVDGCIQQIEALDDIDEPMILARSMQRDFCGIVRDKKSEAVKNPLVRDCMELVKKHIHENITLDFLAKELNVNPSYLSRIFSGECSKTLKTYILEEKINLCKKQLIYTNDAISKIAFSYGFSSQSHFGKVFFKICKETPAAYRTRNALKPWQ